MYTKSGNEHFGRPYFFLPDELNRFFFLQSLLQESLLLLVLEKKTQNYKKALYLHNYENNYRMIHFYNEKTTMFLKTSNTIKILLFSITRIVAEAIEIQFSNKFQ